MSGRQSDRVLTDWKQWRKEEKTWVRRKGVGKTECCKWLKETVSDPSVFPERGNYCTKRDALWDPANERTWTWSGRGSPKHHFRQRTWHQKICTPHPTAACPGRGREGEEGGGGWGAGGLEGEVWFDWEGNNWIDFAFHKMQLETVKAWLAFLQRTQEQGFVPRDNSCRFL